LFDAGKTALRQRFQVNEHYESAMISMKSTLALNETQLKSQQTPLKAQSGNK
jgi:hypothetical protein